MLKCDKYPQYTKGVYFVYKIILYKTLRSTHFTAAKLSAGKPAAQKVTEECQETAAAGGRSFCERGLGNTPVLSEHKRSDVRA